MLRRLSVGDRSQAAEPVGSGRRRSARRVPRLLQGSSESRRYEEPTWTGGSSQRFFGMTRGM